MIQLDTIRHMFYVLNLNHVLVPVNYFIFKVEKQFYQLN